MNNESTPTPENPSYQRLRPPVWDDWKSIEKVRLWQAVALICNLDPNQYTQFDLPYLSRPFFDPPPHNFEELLILAKSAVGSGPLKLSSISEQGLDESEINLSSFGAWAKSVGYKIPSEFPWHEEEFRTMNHEWPWGSYETELLRKLAAAANRFWKLYDPSDPTTAPTSEDVTDWLMKQGVAERNARVMATILRSDNLRPGPRK